jgi:hypothetical protein
MRQGRLVFGLLFGLLLVLPLVFQPGHAWAVGCCRCTLCSPPRPPVFCVDTAGDPGDCNETCLPDCPGRQTFDDTAICGEEEFLDCLGASTQSAPAPALGWLGLALATGGLFTVGLLRGRRRTGGTA